MSFWSVTFMQYSLNIVLLDENELADVDVNKPQNPDVKGLQVKQTEKCFAFGLPELQFVELFR